MEEKMNKKLSNTTAQSQHIWEDYSGEQMG